MRLPSGLCLLPLLLWSGGAAAREVVDASAAQDVSVTVYRDPDREPWQQMNRNWPRGFAMISETRQVTLPPGESRVRFTGVAEGMVAVSAIVTGLPGGTIEKNRNADLLSPAALVDGTLGNRVTITRTNPASGEEVSEDAIIRTRADGGLVLQTAGGYEAVRCSGLPERLEFDAIPDGLSPHPVFSIDTRDEAGGTYTVTLTYLAWGFDWQANYVATLDEAGNGGGQGDDVRMSLTSWLTILNDNGQTFENATLLAVAGRLNVVSNFQNLSDPPDARPLRLACYPLGSSLAGSPVQEYAPPSVPPPPAPPPMMAQGIVVTGARMMAADMEAAVPVMAEEEQLGDLKLYRVPLSMDVNAQGLKQVAFLSRDAVEGHFLYDASCTPYEETGEPVAAEIMFATVNDEDHGLGVALPSGRIAFFEPGPSGDMLVGEQDLRDHAEGQDVELELGGSTQVFARCERLTQADPGQNKWSRMRVTLTNANPAPANVRLQLGNPVQWRFHGIESVLKDGQQMAEIAVPANGEIAVEWYVRPSRYE